MPVPYDHPREKAFGTSNRSAAAGGRVPLTRAHVSAVLVCARGCWRRRSVTRLVWACVGGQKQSGWFLSIRVSAGPVISGDSCLLQPPEHDDSRTGTVFTWSLAQGLPQRARSKRCISAFPFFFNPRHLSTENFKRSIYFKRSEMPKPLLCRGLPSKTLRSKETPTPQGESVFLACAFTALQFEDPGLGEVLVGVCFALWFFCGVSVCVSEKE